MTIRNHSTWIEKGMRKVTINGVKCWKTPFDGGYFLCEQDREFISAEAIAKISEKLGAPYEIHYYDRWNINSVEY